MNLALFGSGEFTDAANDIDKYLIDRFKPSNIAVLPLAAGMESDAHKWIDMALSHYAQFDLPVIELPVFNKAQANDESFAKLLSDADWIFLSGGNPGYLLQSLQDTKIWAAIMKRVNNGALLAGSSAGAMVMGKYLMSAPSIKSIFGGDGIIWHKAFGLVDYTILPHFDHFKKQRGLITKIIDTSPKKVNSSWMGIDEDTAIVYEAGEPRVLGRGGVETHVLNKVQQLK